MTDKKPGVSEISRGYYTRELEIKTQAPVTDMSPITHPHTYIRSLPRTGTLDGIM
jgi:hypothetical protein